MPFGLVFMFLNAMFEKGKAEEGGGNVRGTAEAAKLSKIN